MNTTPDTTPERIIALLGPNEHAGHAMDRRDLGENRSHRWVLRKPLDDLDTTYDGADE